jgi:CHASE2 domain-containing sensor protein
MTSARKWFFEKTKATTLIALGTALVMAVAVALKVFEPFELGALDRLFSLRGTINPRTPITIVGIDDDTLKVLGNWPLPRKLHGQVVEQLSAAGAAVIGLDLIFSEPSAHGSADDEAFAESLRRVRRAVLATVTTVVSEGWYTKIDANLPIPSLRLAAMAVGAVNLYVDSDAIIRRAPLVHFFGSEPFPTFAVELHRVAAMNGIVGHAIPHQPEVRINFVGGPGTFPHLPYHQVLRGQFPFEAVRGRIVLIGTTTPVLRDVFSAPFAKRGEMPGVEIQANALHTLLTGRTIKEGVPLWGQVVIAAMCGAAAAMLVGVAGVRGLVLVGLAIVPVVATAWLAFVKADFWLPTVAPTVALSLGAVARMVIRR